MPEKIKTVESGTLGNICQGSYQSLGNRGGVRGIHEIYRSPFKEIGNVSFPDMFFIWVIDQEMRVEIIIFLKKFQGFFGKE